MRYFYAYFDYEGNRYGSYMCTKEDVTNCDIIETIHTLVKYHFGKEAIPYAPYDFYEISYEHYMDKTRKELEI